ncbi:hypothetical protein EVAR_23330_1 [Eumeta japonica]|uniref:Uncharacterized protein n=1 Tax=Eumeta variegata TaxID=151549 RepID=A0A4C1Y0W0_EUMVA|nr:hypothetical protein EVAR_23330_1 [Eumeta japonica]
MAPPRFTIMRQKQPEATKKRREETEKSRSRLATSMERSQDERRSSGRAQTLTLILLDQVDSRVPKLSQPSLSSASDMTHAINCGCEAVRAPVAKFLKNAFLGEEMVSTHWQVSAREPVDYLETSLLRLAARAADTIAS